MILWLSGVVYTDYKNAVSYKQPYSVKYKTPLIKQNFIVGGNNVHLLST